MNRFTLTALTLAVSMAAAPALAQFPQPQPQPYQGPMVMGGQEGPWAGPVGRDRPYTAQDMAEVPFTQLLNRMSQEGFAAYRSIQRVGDVYIVEAMTTSFELVTLELDPRTGRITRIR